MSGAVVGPPAPAPDAPAPGSSGAAEDWAGVAETVTPSTVTIAVAGRTGQGSGSGVVWDTEGHVVTNAHVVQGARQVQVSLADGRTYPATVVGTDPSSDLAVLQLSGAPDDLLPITVGDDGALQVGDPADEGTVFGPLANHKQKESVEGYIRKGLEEGATIAYGGGEVEGLPENVAEGAFVQPTVFRDVDNSMTIAQEEIFGPVIQVIPYDSVDEAVQIANDSEYGLAGAVYSADPDAALEVAQRVRTGTMGINWYAFDPTAPFGGFKNSGLGRENGPEGLEAYCELQSVLMPLGWEAPA